MILTKNGHLVTLAGDEVTLLTEFTEILEQLKKYMEHKEALEIACRIGLADNTTKEMRKVADELKEKVVKSDMGDFIDIDKIFKNIDKTIKDIEKKQQKEK